MNDHREDIEHEDTERQAAGEPQTEFEKLYDQSLKSFKSGTVVRGRVLQVRSGFVMLDLGYKSDGIIPVEQFTEEELRAINRSNAERILPRYRA